MTALRAQLILLAAFFSVLQSSEGIAAKPKKNWEMFNACQYVDDKNNDGDSFRVKCGEKEFALRLYFVDAPETDMSYPQRTLEQSKHFGATLDETMKGGEQARDTVRSTLKDPFTVWTRWATAGGRSKESRYYGLIEVNGKSLAEMLVGNGLARIKGVKPNLPNGEKASVYLEKLDALEAEAKKRKIGVWAELKK